MVSRQTAVLIGLALISIYARAQQSTPATTTSEGTAEANPVFTTHTDAENSEITKANSDAGIRATSPGASLEVNGNVKLKSNSGASITFVDGSIHSTACIGPAIGGDYADSADVAGDRRRYEPGDVLVLISDGKKERR